MDNKATNHITTDVSNMAIRLDYKGKEKLVVGNGSKLSISHIGYTSIPACSKSLPYAFTDGFIYYLHFVDVCSRFNWIYPLKANSEAFMVFNSFNAYVERQSNSKK